MRQRIDKHIIFSYGLTLIGTTALLCLIFLSPSQTNHVFAQQPANPKEQAKNVKPSVAQPASSLPEFNERVKEYIKLRERLADKADKPSDESKPLEIEAYQIALAEQIKVARATAQAGDIFTPEVAKHIRQVIKDEFKGERLKELRATAQEPNPKGVPLRVNALYPESKELIEMPPALLLKLPELPKQLRYRFIGQHMLLMDQESRLIVDYVLNALP